MKGMRCQSIFRRSLFVAFWSHPWASCSAMVIDAGGEEESFSTLSVCSPNVDPRPKSSQTEWVTDVAFSTLAATLDRGELMGVGREAFGVPTESGFFVDPVLVVKENLGDLQADILLISARGAAGKSRTASRQRFPGSETEKDQNFQSCVGDSLVGPAAQLMRAVRRVEPRSGCRIGARHIS